MGDAFYIMETGVVKVLKEVDGGDPKLLTTLKVTSLVILEGREGNPL